MKLTTLLSAFLLAVTLGATSASAATYRIDLEGVVDFVPSTAPKGLVEKDDTFGFSIIFDAQAAPGELAGPNLVDRFWANLQIQNAYIGVHTNLEDPAGPNGGVNLRDYSDGQDDVLSINAFQTGSSLPTSPGGSTNVVAQMNFGFGLPDSDLSGGDWGNLVKGFLNPANAKIAFVDDSRFERSDEISARITRATISAVPLPAGLPLMAGGLIAFGLIRRRR